MTRIIEDPGGTPPSGLAEQELLQKLIKEGLAPSDDRGETDVTRYRKLVEVLFQACILNPVNQPVTPSSLEQAGYTLTILSRQSIARPELLSCLPPSTELQIPLYKWIIPRLVYAAMRYEEKEGAAGLVEDLSSAALHVLLVLGRDLSDEETSFAKGPRRVLLALKYMVDFCQEIVEGRSSLLFGYPACPSNPVALLFILDIVFRARPAFADQVGMTACLQLVEASRFVKHHVHRQTRYALTVLTALDAFPSRRILIPACVAIMCWPISNDGKWQSAVDAVSRALPKLETPMRLHISRALRGRSDRLHIVQGASSGLLNDPFDPLEDPSALNTVDELIPNLRLERKYDQSKGSDIQSVPTARPVPRQILVSEDRDPQSSRKRKRDGVLDDTEIRQILTERIPKLSLAQGDVIHALTECLRTADATVLSAVIGMSGELFCLLTGCKQHRSPMLRSLPEDIFDLWGLLVSAFDSDLPLLRAQANLFEHTSPQKLAGGLQLTDRQFVMEKAWSGLRSSNRPTRVAAGRVMSLAYTAQYQHINHRVGLSNRGDYRLKLAELLSHGLPTRETAILLLGDVGRHSSDTELCSILELLLQQLGSSSAPLRSLAYTELLGLSKFYGKTPYTLLSAFLERISVFLANSLVRAPDVFGETMQFIGYTRQNFIEMTLRYTIPALILSCNRKPLELIASIVKQNLGVILLDNTSHILSMVFLHPQCTDTSLTFLIMLLRDLTSGQPNMDLSASSLMTTCIVPFVVSLVVELGDDNEALAGNAKVALLRAQKEQIGEVSGADLGSFLKPHMLGVISQLNEMLHDIQGKKTVAYKRKIIRSLGALIGLVGDSMASFSPQHEIMASLQSTLGISELREETLKAWALFVRTLRFVDIGPFVGRTTGALAVNWNTFSQLEKQLAIEIIKDIAGNAPHLTAYFDDVVGMDDIPELQSAAAKLLDYRKTWDTRTKLEKLLERTKSKNVAIATASMSELRSMLCDPQSNINQFSHGNMFDSILARVMRSLLSTSTRDGDCQELRDLSYECMGILGALDADRFVSVPVTTGMTIMSNFADQDESVDFAIHLIRDLLVDAFRATNDTKHQNHLAFAIQELLKFCGFSPKVLQPSSSVAMKLRSKWQMMPKDQLETLTPLLESRFSLNDTSIRTFPHSIYLGAPTYREWVQMWTTDLIGRVMSWLPNDRATCDSQAIFGVCRGVLRNQDVTVAHHLLPHLVLNVLLSGDHTSRDEICLEINTVLQDQVNPVGGQDKRMLSAQVIFDLMDHLSTWLRLQRVGRSDRGAQTKTVEGVLSSIETELMANAALQSKAYARSLRNFEQRIVQLRKEKRSNAELQTYFERLHQIYAELDEPDGMEGVSTFVVSPSLEHQIREHESTGRWTSAQSCWEVRLQQSPEDVNLHLGLLKCLRNLGHYDTLRTHIRGVLSRRPSWSQELASFETEAAWIIGDWVTVKQVGARAPPIAQVFLALQERQTLASALALARRNVGESITSNQYSRSYEPILQLHLLREIETIHNADSSILATQASSNYRAITQQITRDLTKSLHDRFSTTSPTFRVREAILTIRRTAFGLAKAPQLKLEIGHAWIQSSKIARKAGYEQTAYSATLQAKEVDAPFAFLQQAKLLRAHGGAFKALTDLENTVTPLLNTPEIDLTEEAFVKDRNLAKAVLLQARWANETDRFQRNEIIERYRKAITLAPNLESPRYRLGHYYDSMQGTTPEQDASFNFYTCGMYIQALQYGNKYIYQTMPRMLTLWLDLGESKDLRKHGEVQTQLEKITQMLDRARKELATYQFLTAYPQIVSRIGHTNKEVAAVLKKIMALVIAKYPQQALWPTVGVMQSNRGDRKEACNSVLTRAQHGDPGVANMIKQADRLSQNLLTLANDKVENKKRELTVSMDFKYVKSAFPSRMIVPLQDALTCTLPSTANTVKSHNPFPTAPIEIHALDERVEVMASLQRPKKLVFIGTDGRRYPFLCKPHDDLRKDARLMDFNSMINKLLKSASESRRRQLYIRTYAVMPLNEECGLLEWVSNTTAFKSIVEKGYERHGKKIYNNELHGLLDQSRKQGPEALIQVFKGKILPMFIPTVFHEWFLLTWPEPSAWLASRMAYSRTLAVMSMIGYVLGLGDRHCENILFDGLTGDTVHVDLNCLFDKGKTFEIPERVPFRLTQNMVDALGVTGVEGVFRKASEITLDLLRMHSESLISVLEAFAHDPLVEWTKPGRGKSDKDIRSYAERNLKPIKNKLRGVTEDGTAVSVPNHVEVLIKVATSASLLAVMYQGWAAWL